MTSPIPSPKSPDDFSRCFFRRGTLPKVFAAFVLVPHVGFVEFYLCFFWGIIWCIPSESCLQGLKKISKRLLFEEKTDDWSTERKDKKYLLKGSKLDWLQCIWAWVVQPRAPCPPGIVCGWLDVSLPPKVRPNLTPDLKKHHRRSLTVGAWCHIPQEKQRTFLP